MIGDEPDPIKNPSEDIDLTVIEPLYCLASSMFIKLVVLILRDDEQGQTFVIKTLVRRSEE